MPRHDRASEPTFAGGTNAQQSSQDSFADVGEHCSSGNGTMSSFPAETTEYGHTSMSFTFDEFHQAQAFRDHSHHLLVQGTVPSDSYLLAHN